VNIVAGPYANREHMVVTIVEADRADALDSFIVDSRLSQWNQVRILPSVPMQEAMQELQETATLF
jgi:2,4-dienoyl-CoA reductase-like NADH-dependent reductase (Old Yellow Enzyme family)